MSALRGSWVFGGQWQGDLSPQRIENGSIFFYCQVRRGSELQLLQTTDIVADTDNVIAAAKKNGPIAGLINFHCCLRTLELERKKQTEAYGKIFADVPTIGFSTFGEQYIGHVNQTSTMVVFR